MKLEDAKELHQIFKSNLSEMLKRRLKLEDQRSALKNIKSFYEGQDNVFKLFDNYLINYI